MPLDLPYSSIEAALVSAYGVNQRDLGAFRARLTFWQKLGALGVKPGKGKPIKYGGDELHRLIFCLELAECGATPQMVVGTIADLWEKRIRRHFERAEAATAKALPNVNACELARLPDNISLVMNDSDLRRPPRVLVINLSERLRRVHAALAGAWESEQPTTAAHTKAKRNTRKRRRA